MTEHRPPWQLSDDDRPERPGARPRAVPRPTSTPARRSAGAPVTTRRPGPRLVTVVTVVGRIATNERATSGARWLVRNAIIYVADRDVGADPPVVGGAHERPLRTADALRRGGRGLRAADRLGARAEHARERRHRRRMDWITAPLDLARDRRGPGPVRHRAAPRPWRGAGHRAPRHGVAARPGTTRRRHDRLAGVAARRRLASAHRAAPWLLLAGLWQVGRQHGTRAALGRPRRRPGPPDGDRDPGRGRDRAGAPGHPGDEPGGQGRLAGRVRHPTGAGQPPRLPGHVHPADGRDPGDDRRQARRAGPQPRPRPAWRSGRPRPSGPATWTSGSPTPARPNARRRRTRCCTTAPPTCSPGSRSACRSAGT